MANMDIQLENVRGESLRILAKALIEIADAQEKELEASRNWRAQSAGGLLAQIPVANGGIATAVPVTNFGIAQAAVQAAPVPVLTPLDEADLGPGEPSEWADVVEPPGIPEQPTAVSVTLEQVRAKLASLSQAGKAAVVKTLLKKFGATKLTEVDSAKFAELLAEAEAL